MSELNLTGKTLGRFEILNELGRGGMAVVYKARQSDLDRIVALKILPPSLTYDASYIARFRQEARSAARLEHPHIMPIYEIGEAEGLHYIAMKFIEGRTLKEMAQEAGALSVPRAAQVLGQVGEALDYAHRQEIIHRDIKPSNVMITDEGWIYLTDFGLARGAGSSGGLTMTGTVMGTPEYMSPEQAQGLPNVGKATDIYALGVVLYELLTGTFPFQADTPMGMLAARLLHAPTPPRDVRGDLPSPVEDVIMRALARKPEARFPSAAAMVEALRQAAGLTAAQAQRPLTPLAGTPAVDATMSLPPAAPPLPTARPGSLPPLPPLPTPPATPTPYLRPAAATPLPAPRTEAAAPTAWQPPAPAVPRRSNMLVWIGLAAGALALVLALGGLAVLSGRGRPGPEPVAAPTSAAVAERLRSGDAALAEGALDAAAGHYRSALDQSAGTIDALRKLAIVYNLQADWPAAEEHANQVIDAPTADDPASALGFALLADAIASQGSPQAALEAAQQAIALDPELGLAHAIHSNILAARALAIKSTTEMDSALDSADRAADTLRNDEPLLQALAHNALGYTFAQEYFLSGSPAYLTQSESSYKQAAALQPTLALFGSNLAYLYNASNRPEQAREQFASALKLDPSLVSAQSGLGWSYYDAGDQEQAAAAWDAALALNPNDDDAYYGKGRLAYDDKDYDTAIDLLMQAAAHNSYDPLIQAWLGEAYLFRGYTSDDRSVKESSYAKAEEAYRRAIERDDRLAFARSGLGWILQYQEKYDESVKAFERAIQLDDTNDEAHNGMGWSLFYQDKFADAEVQFRRSLELDGEYVDALYGLGRTLTKLGRSDEARAAYQEALRINPDFSAAQEWLDKLD